MNKQTYQLNIAEPCSENWDEMMPNAKGRHCDKCEKTVVDFTGKTDRQIITAIKQAEGRVCGRMLSTQVGRDIQLDSEMVRATKWKTFGLLLSGLLGTGLMNGQPTSSLEIDNKIAATFSGSTNIPKQTKTVKGYVHDGKQGLPNVHVGMEGTSASNITNNKGAFSIEIPVNHGKTLLKIYAFGYETKYLEIAPSFLDGQVIQIDLAANGNHPTVTVAAYQVPLSKGDISLQTVAKVGGIGYVRYPKMFKKSKYKRRVAIQKLTAKISQLLVNRKERLANRRTKKTENKKNTIEIVTIEGQQKIAAPIVGNPQWIQAIYPNPFQDQITVELQSDKKELLELRLFDVAGRSLYKEEVFVSGSIAHTLHLEEIEFVEGSYFLSIFRGAEILQTKLVIRGQ